MASNGKLSLHFLQLKVFRDAGWPRPEGARTAAEEASTDELALGLATKRLCEARLRLCSLPELDSEGSVAGTGNSEPSREGVHIRDTTTLENNTQLDNESSCDRF